MAKSTAACNQNLLRQLELRPTTTQRRRGECQPSFFRLPVLRFGPVDKNSIVEAAQTGVRNGHDLQGPPEAELPLDSDREEFERLEGSKVAGRSCP
jgi:hypothetical protein